MTDSQKPGRAPSAHAIGTRLRQLRTASGRSLRSVAEAVGISSSALSQIETGAMQPSVNRLVEIVSELDAPVSVIFDPHEVFRPVHLEQGDASEPVPGVSVANSTTEKQLGQGVIYRQLSPVHLEGIDFLETVYPPNTSSSLDGAMMVHQGYEVGRVISGRLRFEFSEGSVELGEGESLAFAATRPHRVVNDSSETPASALWLTLRAWDPATGLEAAEAKPAQLPR